MIIDAVKKVDTNVKSSVDFSFGSSSSKIFAMLSSNLYTNKELCVIHELSANCIDAHKLNGNQDKPFEVFLPTTLDNNIKFLDHGPGLSEEDVYRFLTKYGESSKQGSNQFIGGWGIGSKSPAAVSNSWTIVSNHNGSSKEYLVFINEHLVPTIAKIKESPCETTGVIVSIPVNPNRFRVWGDLIYSAYKYYSVKPIIHGKSVSWDPLDETYYKDDSNFYISNKSPEHYWENQAAIIINQRRYSLDFDKISSENGYDKSDIFDSSTLSWARYNIKFHFSVGEIDLNISREGIQYTKKSISAIINKINDFRALIEKLFKTNDFYTNKFDYIVGVNNFVKDNGSVFSNTELLKELLVHNKYGITSRDLNFWKLQLEYGFIEDNRVRFYGGKSVRALAHRSFSSSLLTVGHSRGEQDKFDFLGIDFEFLDKDKLKIVIADCSDVIARVKLDFKETGAKYIISDSDFTDEHTGHLVCLASSLKKQTVKNFRESKLTKNLSHYYERRNGKLHRVLNPDVDASAAVIKLAKVTTKCLNESINSFTSDLIKSRGLKVYYIAKDSHNTLNLPNFMDKIEEDFQAYISSSDYEKNKEIYYYFKNIDYTFYSLMLKKYRTPKIDSNWNKICDKITDPNASIVSGTHSIWNDYCIATKGKELDVKDRDLVLAELSKLYEAYSMFSFLGTYSIVAKNPSIQSYINLVNF